MRLHTRRCMTATTACVCALSGTLFSQAGKCDIGAFCGEGGALVIWPNIIYLIDLLAGLARRQGCGLFAFPWRRSPYFSRRRLRFWAESG